MKWLKNQLARVMKWLNRFRPFELVLWPVFGILAVDFAAAELHQHHWEPPHVWYALAGLAGALVAAWRVYMLAHRLITVRTRKFRNEVPAPRCEHLVVFVSHLTELGQLDPDGTPKGLTLGKHLDEDIRQLQAAKGQGVRWVWEIPLRAIQHHRSVLHSITLVCSAASMLQIGWLGKIVQGYGLKVKESEKPVDLL